MNSWALTVFLVLSPPTTYSDTINIQPGELLFARELLTAEPGSPYPPWSDQQMLAIQQVAMDEEILDIKETGYTMFLARDFDIDLEHLRSRYQLLKNAPKLEEHKRFGQSRDQINKMIVFNRSFRKKMEIRQAWELDRAELFRDVIQETDDCYYAWDKLRDAKCEFYYISVRRNALKDLKRVLGEDRFNRAEMIDYVPVWRFNQGR